MLLLFQEKTSWKEGAKVGNQKADNQKVVRVTSSLTSSQMFTGLLINTNLEVLQIEFFRYNFMWYYYTSFLAHFKWLILYLRIQNPDNSPDKKRGHGGGRGKPPATKPSGPKPKPGGRGRGQGKDPEPEPQTSNYFVVITGVLTGVLLFILTVDIVINASVVSGKKMENVKKTKVQLIVWSIVHMTIQLLVCMLYCRISLWDYWLQTLPLNPEEEADMPSM